MAHTHRHLTDSAREARKFLALGKPYLCVSCGWVIQQSASNADKKRDLLCRCQDCPFEMPADGAYFLARHRAI